MKDNRLLKDRIAEQLMAIYLTEYAHTSVKRYVFPLLDILAGLPSVIYGVWGMLVIVPWVADVVAPSLKRDSSGYTVLATHNLNIHIGKAHILKNVNVEIPQNKITCTVGLWNEVKDRLHAPANKLSGGQQQRLGEVIEQGDAKDIFNHPQHELTKNYLSGGIS